MNNTRLQEIQTSFNELIKERQKFCYITRDINFQRQACDKLIAFAQRLKDYKANAVQEKDEDTANAIFSFESMVESLLNELRMWICLKTDDPNMAWDYLIKAQGDARWAMQAHGVAAHLEPYILRLHSLEKILFPKQIFTSAGFIAEGSECSICGSEYGECDHIKGRCYNGELCTRYFRKPVFYGQSIVEDPVDKHSRIIAIQDGKIMRDVMTWNIITDEKTEETSQDS